MCLSIPSKIKSIDPEMNTCVVDTMGVERSASLDLIDEEVKVGDYVLIHIGFAMNKIDEEYALESLKLYEKIIEEIEQEDRLAEIEESQNCQNR
ncbi:HypC/HybG/HupF family hydrogenase formation chaperone [Aliarcobacter skirrowii]|jgi:hydrogenase expression/formation protein HypC|uniref:Hydrogenase assembly chaperone HypC n=1 Tax=Aliarcobacter skirrowii CCUG 10374 TaxID=1032239 RepID=A0AAD0WP53_9BACT|nr:HypC/HybG/HupF family hydrogenase formation chaperone [Aliarcobacter skirrowii]AXX85633.1 hydrogenase assembly chaperone HypC [Aliarcobacter skirrowii CCUG 10374]AZL54698.1 HypC/HybG/HupF family hydrogenase formation chaperone [Aliarcobacter skirrowii]KAB0620960.1 HypC/HybG/HupF family hydrogenase formation chaperone [Aliarcobacter skirrowii CCUG 10374]MDX4050259.1 HypC/HybG/HupF family hydrogenase formation chaperone [Aliarcobacter skirrowii]RXI26132.1 HypC/HybG/HupF family hydrogenase for